jgi:hypothetical protein
MKKHILLFLGLGVASILFLGCGSAKPEPTEEDLKKIEQEVIAGESKL